MVSRAVGARRRGHGAGALRSAAALAALLLSGATGAAAQVRVEARLEPARIALGGTAELVIEVSGAGIRSAVSEPVLPDLGPIEVVGRTREWGVRMAGTDVTRHTTFRYVLRPTAGGTLRIDPVAVTVDGRTHQTAVRRILVVDAEGVGPAWRDPTGPPLDDPEGPPAIFAVTRVDRASAWVGEQVTLTFTFYHDPRVPLSDSPDYDPPDTPGFWRIELDDAPRVGVERIGGRSYHVQRFSYALFPLRAGALEVGPATVRVVEPDRARWWLPGEPRTIRTEPLVIDARALPVPAPAGFEGAVGRFRLSGGLVARRAAVGSPLELELTVDGTGNPSSVPAPVLPDWPDVAVRAPAVDAATAVRGRTVEGWKTFRWLLVPRTEGALDLGLARLAYFDPAAGAFSVDSLRLGEIRVEPGAVGGEEPAAAVGPTLWPARTPAAPRPRGLAGEPWYWAALAGPWLGWLALLATRRGRRSRSADRSRQDARDALARAAATLEAGAPAPGAAAAIEAALEAGWGVRLAGVAPGGRRERLAEAGVPTAVVEAAEAAREAVARTAWGGSPPVEAAARMAALADAIEWARPARRSRRGARWAVPLAFAALVAATPAGPQADSRAAWEAANRDFRAGDFAAAAAVYETLLAERRDPYLLADLAAAEWRAGRSATAAARYLEALELAPREPAIRADLERLRARLGDPPGLAAAVDRMPPVRLDELLVLLLAASWLGAVAVAATPARGRRLAAAVALSVLTLGAAAAAGTAVVVGGGPDAVAGPGAVLAGRPGGPPIAPLPEGAALDVLAREAEAWRVRAPGLPAGWVASAKLVPLD